MGKNAFFLESREQNRLLWYIFVSNYGVVGPGWLGPGFLIPS